MNKKTAIKVDHISVQYKKDVWGIQDISAQFQMSEIIALIGANGAGKSTFLNTLSGLLEPTSGEVYYHKQYVDFQKPFHEIGWTKQTHAIDWYLNVYDNVLLQARLAGMKRQEAKEKTLKALKLTGLDQLSNRDVDALSGGQQQRIQIARALVHDPSIMILDEPTTGLDAEIAEKLLISLKEKAEQGALVIISSHDLNLIERFCDKVMLLKGGRLLTFESTETFLSRYIDKEILIIDYEGDLSCEVIQSLEEIVIRVSDTKPLRLELNRGMPIGEVIRILDSYVRVIDLKRTSPGLREAYLEIAKGRAEVKENA